MTHTEYKKAIEADRKFVQDQLKLWTDKAEHAKAQVHYWMNQEKAMSSVGARVSLGDNSVFYDKKSS